MSRLMSIIQFMLGFILGVGIIAMVSASAGYYYISGMAVDPPKPTFVEENEKPLEETEVEDETISEAILEPEPEAILEPQLEEIPEPELEEIPEPEPEELLPPNAYKARVTWPEGLSLRAEPTVNSERIGGMNFNAEIIILEENDDGSWQKVRLPWNQQEGWVKGGNTKRVY